MMLFLEIFCTYLMMSLTLALSLPASDGGDLTSSGPCSLNCSNIINSSTNTGVRYSLLTSSSFYTPGYPIRVSIQSTACLKDYDQSLTVGPSWYRIEAIYGNEDEDSERDALGAFTIAENMEEASHCSKSVVFQSIKPSLLDLPASFYWTPEKYSHCSEETKKPVCFRATVQHHGDPHCQTTEICVQLTNDTIKCPEIPSVAPTSTVTSNYTSVTPSVTPTPSQDRVNQCLIRWSCESARPNEFCGSNGMTFQSRCLWRRYKCIHQVDITITRGACLTSSSSTPSPTPTPTPTPVVTPQCKRIYDIVKNIKNEWHPQCTKKGTAKPVQCHRKPNGQLECWCSRENLSEKSGTRKNISDCNSPIDLDCWEF